MVLVTSPDSRKLILISGSTVLSHSGVVELSNQSFVLVVVGCMLTLMGTHSLTHWMRNCLLWLCDLSVRHRSRLDVFDGSDFYRMAVPRVRFSLSTIQLYVRCATSVVMTSRPLVFGAFEISKYASDLTSKCMNHVKDDCSSTATVSLVP